MVDPAVGQRPAHRLGRQVDGVLVRVLAELGHVDPQDPQLFRCRCHCAQPPSGSKPKPTASVPLSSVPMTSVARRTFMPSDHVLGVRCHVDQVRPHAGALAVDHRGDEGNRDPRRGEGHDGEGPDLARVGDAHLLEVGPLAGGAGVAAVEEAGAARGALVGHQVGVVPQHQVVDQRDLLRHRAPKSGRIRALRLAGAGEKAPLIGRWSPGRPTVIVGPCATHISAGPASPSAASAWAP